MLHLIKLVVKESLRRKKGVPKKIPLVRVWI